MQRVLIKDVAKRAGVHAATVSRALRDDARIRVEVRKRIRKLATEMGYRPDPHLRALAKYRSKTLGGEYRGLLAWVTNAARRDGWRHNEKLAYFEGAKRRAAELGYDIDLFWTGERGMTPERLKQILLARGIRGVLLPPPEPGMKRVELDWTELAVVSFGCSRVTPRLHSIHCHHYRAMEAVLAELWSLGYRRPGLALRQSVDASVDGAWSAAYLRFVRDSGRRLPTPLINAAWGRTELLDWYRNARPDVVVTELHEALGWLRAGGVVVPDACGFAMCARHPEHADCAGIDENSAVTGVAAVDLLTSLVERGEFGVPCYPQNVLIEGAWSPIGQTLRAH